MRKAHDESNARSRYIVAESASELLCGGSALVGSNRAAASKVSSRKPLQPSELVCRMGDSRELRLRTPHSPSLL